MRGTISISASFESLDEMTKIHDAVKLYMSLFMKKYENDIVENVEPRIDKGQLEYYFEFEFPRTIPDKYFINIMKILKGKDIQSIL